MNTPSSTIAPADSVARAPWPLWRKVAAYVLLSAVSLGAIYLIDLKVTRHQLQPTAFPVVRDAP